MGYKHMIHNDYQFNKPFRDYVDRYAADHNITPEEALKRTEVQQAARYYTEV
ncbi:MAG: hypothetical protein Q4F83_11110 [Eubacteriales bacterium]|nr:hypothetical protein [Eubacteriales bacterium]